MEKKADHSCELNSLLIEMFSELANRIHEETGAEVLDVWFDWDRTSVGTFGEPNRTLSTLLRTTVRASRSEE